ncbi:hypothetical protein T492DRAFT_954800 [Pavlovales sp. CCMP2436]|nr:hypothetical protein T492DRAFT_954800 [Pavlovales sp. CCMP2436]
MVTHSSASIRTRWRMKGVSMRQAGSLCRISSSSLPKAGTPPRGRASPRAHPAGTREEVSPATSSRVPD